MKMKTITPGPEHQSLMADLKAVIRKHGESLNSDTILAICSQLVGQVLAVQDQRVMTPTAAIEIIQINLEIGNAAAIAELVGTPANTRPI